MTLPAEKIDRPPISPLKRLCMFPYWFTSIPPCRYLGDPTKYVVHLTSILPVFLMHLLSKQTCSQDRQNVNRWTHPKVSLPTDTLCFFFPIYLYIIGK
jgi:hypothetical protein